MMAWNVCMIVIGGCCGAIARHIVSQFVGKRFSSFLPYGTLSVNLLGSFLLGWLYGGQMDTSILLLLGTGFMGAFTTFSTLSVEIVQLSRNKQWKSVWVYVGATYIAGIMLAFLGYSISGVFI